MSWVFNGSEAVFVQIANRLRCEIVNGKYPPGGQIPPVRQLAFEAAVNPNTMQKALTVLEDEGLLHSKGTVGRFVTDDGEMIKAARETIKRNAVKSWLSEAGLLGMTAEELINYILEEEKSNEHTDIDLPRSV